MTVTCQPNSARSSEYLGTPAECAHLSYLTLKDKLARFDHQFGLLFSTRSRTCNFIAPNSCWKSNYQLSNLDPLESSLPTYTSWQSGLLTSHMIGIYFRIQCHMLWVQGWFFFPPSLLFLPQVASYSLGVRDPNSIPVPNAHFLHNLGSRSVPLQNKYCQSYQTASFLEIALLFEPLNKDRGRN